MPLNSQTQHLTLTQGLIITDENPEFNTVNVSAVEQPSKVNLAYLRQGDEWIQGDGAKRAIVKAMAATELLHYLLPPQTGKRQETAKASGGNILNLSGFDAKKLDEVPLPVAAFAACHPVSPEVTSGHAWLQTLSENLFSLAGRYAADFTVGPQALLKGKLMALELLAVYVQAKALNHIASDPDLDALIEGLKETDAYMVINAYHEFPKLGKEVGVKIHMKPEPLTEEDTDGVYYVQGELVVRGERGVGGYLKLVQSDKMHQFIMAQTRAFAGDNNVQAVRVFAPKMPEGISDDTKEQLTKAIAKSHARALLQLIQDGALNGKTVTLSIVGAGAYGHDAKHYMTGLVDALTAGSDEGLLKKLKDHRVNLAFVPYNQVDKGAVAAGVAQLQDKGVKVKESNWLDYCKAASQGAAAQRHVDPTADGCMFGTRPPLQKSSSHSPSPQSSSSRQPWLPPGRGGRPLQRSRSRSPSPQPWLPPGPGGRTFGAPPPQQPVSRSPNGGSPQPYCNQPPKRGPVTTADLFSRQIRGSMPGVEGGGPGR